MQVFTDIDNDAVVNLLRAGAIGVLRTDTLYGVVGLADNQQVVERIYDVKNRSLDKSSIILINTLDQLYQTPTIENKAFLNNKWPGPVSIILPTTTAPEWLIRDNESLAYRMPNNDKLRSLIAQVGRLIAPSANPEGQSPAKTLQEAIDYFGDSVDFYVDGGLVESLQPSQLIRLSSDGQQERLR